MVSHFTEIRVIFGKIRVIFLEEWCHFSVKFTVYLEKFWIFFGKSGVTLFVGGKISVLFEVIGLFFSKNGRILK